MTATVLVASDVHGRLALLYAVAARFERDFRCDVEALVVTGDLGVWPDDFRLDAATRKLARSVPDELGFRALAPLLPVGDALSRAPHVVKHLAEARRALRNAAASLRAPLYFIGGNHEDFAYLEACRALAPEGSVTVPVDRDDRAHWVPSGTRFALRTSEGPLTFAALGGISATEGGRDPQRYHPGALLHEDCASALLDASLPPPDVLLTHDSGRDFVQPGRGAALVDEVRALLAPRVHLSGHYHSDVPARREGPGDTLVAHLNTLIPSRENRLRPNALGVLTLSREGGARFEFAPRAWLEALSGSLWREW